MKTRATTLAALLLLSPLAMAQPGSDAKPPAQPPVTDKPPMPPPTAAHPATPPPAAQPNTSGGLQPMPMAVNPPFARLSELGPDGKIKQVDGILDILAIPRNPLVDQATREKIRPLVKAWMSDIDQLAIDNLDFLEKIEPPDGSPGAIETLDINDMKKVQYVAHMMTQLMSAGPLSSYLEQKEGFTREQSSMNQQISSDYLQQVMNEIMAANGTPNDLNRAPLTEDQKVKQVNAVSRFLYYISCRDTMQSYHRQLESNAPIMDKVVDALNLSAEQKAKVQGKLGACKSAGTDLEKRKASRAVLDQLTFDQRREALTKARAMLPAYDPIEKLGPSIPPPPNAGKPVQAGAPAAETPPAVYVPQTTPAKTTTQKTGN